MMNYYSIEHEVFFNGEKIGLDGEYIMEEKELQDEVKLYSGLELLGTIANTGHLPEELRGIVSWERRILHPKLIVLHAWGIDFNGIYRVLNKTDNIIYKITYKKKVPSLKKILEYHDGEKAIQWLKDRGITTCPLNPR